MVRFLLPAFVLAAAPAFADETSGTVLAYDRVANIIVMEDKSVFEDAPTDLIPEGLVAGDVITVVFTSNGDNGIGAYKSITKN